MNAMLRLVGWVLALALVVLPIVAVLNGWVGASQWPLTKLRVTGQFERVDGALLQKTLLPYAQHGFFAVDLAAAQDAVSKLPWVERAEVRKRWPDVLEVTVSEHRPFARWGEDLLLSQQGKLFPAKGIQVPKGLPQFGGPESRVSEVVELYNESRALFAPIGLDVRDVELDPRGSWTLGLDNGARIVVGRSEARAQKLVAGMSEQALELAFVRGQHARGADRIEQRLGLLGEAREGIGVQDAGFLGLERTQHPLPQGPADTGARPEKDAVAPRILEVARELLVVGERRHHDRRQLSGIDRERIGRANHGHQAGAGA